MGYTVCGGEELRVTPEGETRAVAALQAWNRDDVGNLRDIPWGDPRALADATDLVEAWAAIGFDAYEARTEDDGSRWIALEHGDSWSSEYDSAAEVIGEHVIEGDLCWTGEDDTSWRWHFTGTADTDVEQSGTTIYGPETTALDRIAAALNTPDPDGWDVGIMDTIADILRETGRDVIDVVEAWHNQR